MVLFSSGAKYQKIPNRIDKKIGGMGYDGTNGTAKAPTRSECADSSLACKGLARGGGHPPYPKLIVKMYLLFIVFYDTINT